MFIYTDNIKAFFPLLLCSLAKNPNDGIFMIEKDAILKEKYLPNDGMVVKTEFSTFELNAAQKSKITKLCKKLASDRSNNVVEVLEQWINR